MTQSSLLDRAKQGDLQAITEVINYLLRANSITALTKRSEHCLNIVLQADKTPDQEHSVAFIQKIVKQLQLTDITQVKVYGRRKGSTFLAWTQVLNLETPATHPPDFWASVTHHIDNFAEAVSETTANVGATLGNTALQAGQNIAKTATELGVATSNLDVQKFSQAVAEGAIKTGETVKQAVSQTAQSVAETVADQPAKNQTLDLAKVPEADRLAFYSALFAIAAADGSIDKEELNLIFETIDLEGMSEAAKRQVQSYIIEPPALAESLKRLSQADETLRFGLMFNLIDTALADELLDVREKEALQLAKRELRVSNEQVVAIAKFIKQMKEIRDRGLDDNYAADAVKNAASGLTAVGIPVAAVYFSGSVMGLSAAGITSGLAAIGLGFGMIPGIGVAILVGTAAFIGVSKLLDTGDTQKKQQLQAERERKAQLVTKNLQMTINTLVEQIQALQSVASDAESNREAIKALNERLKSLQSLLVKRKRAQGAA